MDSGLKHESELLDVLQLSYEIILILQKEDSAISRSLAITNSRM